jgi:hypothetical protein
MDKCDDEGGQIVWSAEEVDRRFRATRRVGIAVLLASGVSLAVAMILQPAPPLYVGASFVIGMLFGLGAVFMRHNQQGFATGLLSGVLLALSFAFRDAMFPEMGDDVFAGFWAAMSAMVLGIASVLLPLMRFSLQRKMPDLRNDAALARRYREQGDSSFVAQMRVTAEKTSKGRMIVSIVMGSVMVGLGLYVWFATWEIFALLLTGMMSAAVALLIWTLTLRHHRIEPR